MPNRGLFALRTALLVGSSLVALPALAQTAPSSLSQPGDGLAATESDRADRDDIVVTGSRVGRTEFNSPSPIQVITADSIALRGITDTASAIQASSIASGSIQQNQTTVGFGQSGIQGGNGTATANLRGLEALRTLVLINGRRVTAAGAGGNIAPVDLSVIPLSMVSRVEILKDGGSSIYGSDAIGGVVNIITRRDLNGGFLTGNYTMPFNSGGESMQLAGGLGWKNDRAYVGVTFEYFHQLRLPLNKRSFLNCATDYVFSPTTGARIDLIDPATGQPKCFNAYSGGVTVPGIPGQLQYDPTNRFGPYGAYEANAYLAQGFHRVNIPGNFDSFTRAYFDNPQWTAGNSALPETSRYSVFATAGYDFTPKFHFYTEFLASQRDTLLTNLAFLQPTIGAAHPSNPFGRAATPFILQPPRNVGIDNRQLTSVKYFQVTAGFNGTFGSEGFMANWAWDIYGQFGRSRSAFKAPIVVTDAFLYSDGNLANGECFVGGVTVTPVTGRACVPINWFSPDKLAGTSGLNASEAAFIYKRQDNRTSYSQNVVEGSLSGGIFKLPAGEVRGAFGAQYIYNAINDQPDIDALRGNLTPFGGVAVATVGKQSSIDVYGELVVPVLRNAPIARELTVTGSVRGSKPSGNGWHFTYEGGLNWEIVRPLRIRATYGTSYRAPATFERNLAPTTLFYNQTIFTGFDPCINPGTTVVAQRCAADGIPAGYNGTSPNGNMGFAAVVSSGNPDLLPETAKTWTLGAVVTPGFTDLSIAVDYFNIDLRNKITTLSGQEVFLCYYADDYPTSRYCNLFTRDRNPTSPTYLNIATVNDAYINAAIQKTSGLDFTLRWNIPLGQKLVFRMDHQYTRTFHDLRASFPDSAFTESNGILLQPKFTGTSVFSLDRGDWTFSWNLQVIGPTSSDAVSGGKLGPNAHFATLVNLERTTPWVTYSGITLRKKVPELGMTLQLGIQNLFDKDPPKVSSNYIYRRGNAPLSLYDFLGRRLYVSLNKTF